ncbi:MAG TPA: zinc-binding alcohol dehydrogenase family protein, partial [Polyangia bacterium]
MRALRFERFGPPSVLQLAEVPTPSRSTDEALVEIRAAAINPSDVKNVAGKMSQTKLPRTPGRDFAGVVVDGPRQWRGVAVWGTGGELGFTRDGTHAEAVVVPVAALRRKPESLTFSEAAAVGTPFTTAQLGLTRASLGERDLVLVLGAVGAVGSAAVQIAAWRGATVFGLVKHDAEVAQARSFGAREVVVSGAGDVVEAIAKTLGGRGVDVAFDTTGSLLDAAVRTLARNGRVVAISAPSDGNATFALRELYRRDGQILGVNTLWLTAVDAAAILEELTPG